MAAADDLPPKRAPLTAMLEVNSLGRGGMETVVVLLATGLRSFGVDPVVVCTESGGLGVEALRARGVRVEVLFGDDKAAQMAAILDRLGVGVLNAHYSTLGLRIAAERGIPTVVTLHNSYAWFGPGTFDEMGSIDPYVSCYIAVSRSAAGFAAKRFHIAPERIQVVRNGIAPTTGAGRATPEERSALLAELGLPPDAEVVVQIGRIERLKGQLALIDAMARLRESHPHLVALIVGAEGELQYARTTRHRVEEEGLLDRVCFLGERDDVARILAATSVAVMPSVVEGLSLAAVEALQAGVPIVLTRTGDAAELLGEGDATPSGALPGALIDCPVPDLFSQDWSKTWEAAGVDHPPHAGALADALAEVFDDLPARRTAALRRGAELKRELSAERMCHETAKILREVVLGGSLANRLELAAVRQRLAEESARNGTLQRTIDQLRALVAEQADGVSRIERQLGEVAGTTQRVERRLGEVAGTTQRVLDKLRIKHRVQTGFAAALGRVTGKPARPGAASASNNAAVRTAEVVEVAVLEDRRARVRQWLVLPAQEERSAAAALRSDRMALDLARAGERVTVANGCVARSGLVANQTEARRPQSITPDVEAFARWMEGRDDRLRVLLATSDPTAIEVARLARARGARVICDVTEAAGQAAVPGTLADALAISDDLITAVAAMKQTGDWTVRTLHVLPDETSVASALVALATPPTAAVIVLCHNNVDIIETCVESLVANRARVNYQIAIVDNSSSDGSWEWLEARGRKGDVLVLRNDRNGCSSGRNLGVRATGGEFVVFLDSDQRALHPGWLDPALDILCDNQRIGAVAWNAGWFKRGTGGGPIVDDLPERGMGGRYAGACFRTDVAFLATSGFAAPRSVMARTAGFDEFYDPTCFEDTDMSFQIKALGYRLAYCPHIAIDHRPHATTGSLREYSDLYKRNEEYFLKKWRQRPEFFFDVD